MMHDPTLNGIKDPAMKEITKLFVMLKEDLEDIPEWKAEINHVKAVLEIPLEEVNPDFFYEQYVFVVLCSYWKEQIARAYWEKFLKGNWDTTQLPRGRKQEAAAWMKPVYKQKFEELKSLKTDEYKLLYLDTLPMIGEVTCRHLGRNLGIDCVKPDRHMNRIAAMWGYGSQKKVSEQIKITTRMCKEIQNDLGYEEKLGVIDVILWRSCNLGWI